MAQKKKEYKSKQYKSKECKCNINFYIPLPSLNHAPKSEHISTTDWFRPGTIQIKLKECPPNYDYLLKN